MKRILLLSSSKFLIDHPKIFDKPFKDMKMAYIITASKGSTNLDYLQRERDFFKQQNYNYTELDIDGKNESELKEILSKYEIVYVTGGNSFYLLKSIKESGFDKVIKELISGGVIYMGASAGSYVACPTIEQSKWKHQDKYNHYKVEDLQAMNLVPFLVTVHYKPEYDDVLKENIPKTKLPVRILTDDQAILIQDDKTELLGEGKEINL